MENNNSFLSLYSTFILYINKNDLKTCNGVAISNFSKNYTNDTNNFNKILKNIEFNSTNFFIIFNYLFDHYTNIKSKEQLFLGDIINDKIFENINSFNEDDFMLFKISPKGENLTAINNNKIKLINVINSNKERLNCLNSSQSVVVDSFSNTAYSNSSNSESSLNILQELQTLREKYDALENKHNNLVNNIKNNENPQLKRSQKLTDINPEQFVNLNSSKNFIKLLINKLHRYKNHIQIIETHFSNKTTPSQLFHNKFPKPFLYDDDEFIKETNKHIRIYQTSQMNLALKIFRERVNILNPLLERIKSNLIDNDKLNDINIEFESLYNTELKNLKSSFEKANEKCQRCKYIELKPGNFNKNNNGSSLNNNNNNPNKNYNSNKIVNNNLNHKNYKNNYNSNNNKRSNLKNNYSDNNRHNSTSKNVSFNETATSFNSNVSNESSNFASSLQNSFNPYYNSRFNNNNLNFRT